MSKTPKSWYPWYHSISAPFRLIAVGHLALLIATWALWTPQTAFPQVPLISIAGRLPNWVDWSLLTLLVSALSVMLVSRNLGWLKWASVAAVGSSFGLILIDQHRLQPWAWEFAIVSVVLGCADRAMSFAAWRWVVIGIYGWSAWSKIDYGFVVEHGPFLLDGICKAVHIAGTRTWPTTLRDTLAATIPAIELIIAIGLVFKLSRRVALIGSLLMHVGLLLALGPLGHGHQPGVLLWNLFFIIQNGLLFWNTKGQDQATHSSEQFRLPRNQITGNQMAWLVVASAMAWPSLESFGLCDHWPAWAVYAAKPERVTLFIDEGDAHRLPEALQRYVDAQISFGDSFRLKLDRWSLDTLRAPIYPQDRFHVGVTLALAQKYQLDHLQLVIEEPANRWTGRRIVHEYVDTRTIQKLAASYRCNAIPRSSP